MARMFGKVYNWRMAESKMVGEKVRLMDRFSHNGNKTKVDYISIGQ